ncbi:MAG: 3-hydroxylacyl-ACP dehydratase [Myxococcaceae bacterium]|nr:3-hydroxylacyl-ACP dehydratase [Myxococcaceae bacterium]
MAFQWTIAELIPHRGALCLLDGVIESHGPRLRAQLTVRDDGFFFDAVSGGGVPAWVGLEYMAQTAAAHVGVEQRLAGSAPRVGFLLGTRRYRCNVPVFTPGTVLTVSVERVALSHEGLAAYEARIEGAGVVATSQVNCLLPLTDEAADAIAKGQRP